MKIADFNIHLPAEVNDVTGNIALQESSVSPEMLTERFHVYENELKKYLSSGHLMLFNQNIINDLGFKTELDKIKDSFDVKFSVVPNIRNDKVFEYIEKAKSFGASGIKFHSYIQEIEEKDFDMVVKISKFAESKGMIISFDTSYGTSKMFRCDNLKLASAVSDQVSNVPIVLLHSGGLRALKAMLLADEKRNVFIETSFSSHFYKGSRIFDDIVFSLKKLGTERFLFGSDFPYISEKDSVEMAEMLCEKAGFNEGEKEMFFYENFQRLFNE